tara:strand:- start:12932 stop:13447 length:516 start_codon:yes stop_codon:yes gene_type:complete
MNKNFKVGLFGTCGSSTWRKDFIETYKELGIDYFNPQLGEGEWTPECADIENQHFKTDEIILFPVTNETTGLGSLAEVGFSIAETLRNLNERYLVVYIAPDCIDSKADANEIKTSIRTRKLVSSKVELEADINEKVFIVNSLEEMKSLSIEIAKYIKEDSFSKTQKFFKGD